MSASTQNALDPLTSSCHNDCPRRHLYGEDPVPAKAFKQQRCAVSLGGPPTSDGAPPGPGRAGHCVTTPTWQEDQGAAFFLLSDGTLTIRISSMSGTPLPVMEVASGASGCTASSSNLSWLAWTLQTNNTPTACYGFYC